MSEKISAFWQNFLAGLCKLLSTCRWVHFEKFLKKMSDTFYHSRTLSKAFFGIQSKISQQGCQKKLSKFSIIAGHWAKSFLSVVENIAAVLPKLHSTCLQEQFEWSFFSKKSLQFLLYYSDTERKNFGFLSIFLRRSCQKCFLHIHGNISTENIFYNID